MVHRWEESLVKSQREGKQRMPDAKAILDKAAAKGHLFNPETIRLHVQAGEAGKSPENPGPEPVIPYCFWILVVTTIQLCQVVGMEFKPEVLKQMLLLSIVNTPFEFTKNGTKRKPEGLLLLHRLREVLYCPLSVKYDRPLQNLAITPGGSGK